MVLFCHVTTRVEGDKYPKLLSEKGGTGFPYLVFMDAEGNVTAKQGERTVAGFQKSLDALSTVAKLETKEKAGDASVAADLLLARMQLGSVSYEDAKQKRAALGNIDAAKLKAIDQQLINLEYGSLMKAPPRSKEDADARNKTLAEMFQAGRIPDGQSALSFCNGVISHAKSTKDAKLFEQAFARMKQAAGNNAMYQKALDSLQKDLDALKAGGN